MNTLVVYTYPHRESLNAAFLESTLAGLKLNEKVSEIRTLDLYAEGFDPVLVFGKNALRRNMYLDPSMEASRQQILWADLIVFIYPIWWGRPPAMLMGYFDRLMASKFAYQDIPGKALPDGLLAGRSVVCVSTMKGPSGYLQYWLNNAHQVLMRRAVFNFVGIDQVKFFEFGNMEKKEGKQKLNLEKIKTYFSKYQHKVKTKKMTGLSA